MRSKERRGRGLKNKKREREGGEVCTAWSADREKGRDGGKERGGRRVKENSWDPPPRIIRPILRLICQLSNSPFKRSVTSS